MYTMHQPWMLYRRILTIHDCCVLHSNIRLNTTKCMFSYNVWSQYSVLHWLAQSKTVCYGCRWIFIHTKHEKIDLTFNKANVHVHTFFLLWRRWVFCLFVCLIHWSFWIYSLYITVNTVLCSMGAVLPANKIRLASLAHTM